MKLSQKLSISCVLSKVSLLSLVAFSPITSLAQNTYSSQPQAPQYQYQQPAQQNVLSVDFESVAPAGWSVEKKESAGSSVYKIYDKKNQNFNMMVSVFDLTKAKEYPKSSQEVERLLLLLSSRAAQRSVETRANPMPWGEMGSYTKFTDSKETTAASPFKFLHMGLKVIDKKMYLVSFLSTDASSEQYRKQGFSMIDAQKGK